MAYSDRQERCWADGAHVLPFSRASIALLRADWEDLAACGIERNVFLEPWVAQAALSLIAPDEADIVAFYDTDRLIGLAIVVRAARYAHLPLTHYCSHLHVHQFLATPLVRQEGERCFAAMLTGWLDRAPDSVTFCRFTHMSADAPVHKALQTFCGEDNRRCDVVQRQERPAIDARQDLDEYLNTHISSRRKKRLRRLGRRLAELGQVRFEQIKDPASLGRWLDDFMALEQKGWKGNAGTAITCSAAEVSFFRQLAGEALRRDQLIFSRLTVGGHAVAYALDLRSGDRVFSLKVAFDPDYSRFSPGMQLEFHCLQHFLADPSVSFVDSCASAGNTSLRGLWAQSVPIAQLVVARKGLRYGLPLTAARFLEKASAAGTRIIRMPVKHHPDTRPETHDVAAP